MNHYFLDASAIVKYYVDDPDSEWVREVVDLLDPRTVRSANTTLIFNSLLPDAETTFDLATVISRDFHAAARLTQQYPLKAYDTVQLAIALRQHQALARRRLALIFVSGDQQQMQAADAEGLAVDNPFDHLSPSDSLTPT